VWLQLTNLINKHEELGKNELVSSTPDSDRP
jgi:hypothetical protein